MADLKAEAGVVYSLPCRVRCGSWRTVVLTLGCIKNT